ncbi:MAG: RidA family protein, partial [Burkholderiaceae bacterium]
MTGKIASRLKQMGVTLPAAVAPAANYVPTVRSGNMLYVAGQVPVRDGKTEFVGKLGAAISVAQGQQAARLCAINILAQVAGALDGDLDRVVRCVRLGGFVNAVPEFTEQPQVINGASDFIVDVFGDAGKHARAAVGVGSLPRGVAVEIDAIFEVR